ncbi:MAG: hypothetical protein HYY93_01800 [Planctomycetes bacterium]|nr:hypothetical protein [Planctomycetota bacterium]
MTLITPPALIALISLPLLVWLLRVRARPAVLVVPSLDPWKRIAGAHPQAAARWIRRWSVIVLLHLLGGAAAVVAMAGPEGEPSGPVPRIWVILVDYSGRMGAKCLDGETRLEKVRRQLFRVIEAAQRDDRFLILIARPDRPPEAAGVVFSDRLLGALPRHRRGYLVSDASMDLAPWLSAARAAVAAESGPAHLVVFTDRKPLAVAPREDESWVLVGDAAPNVGITGLSATSLDPTRSDLFVEVTNGAGPASECLLEVRPHEGVTLASRRITLPEGSSATCVFRDLPLQAWTHVGLAGADGQWVTDALSADNVASLSISPEQESVIAVVGDPDRDIDRALRSTGGVVVTRAAPAAIPEDADLIVSVGEAVPVRSGIPCVWIAPRAAAGPFRPGPVRDRPAIVDVRTGMVELTGVDVRVVQWRRVRSFEIDPSAAGAVRVMAATEAGPLLARWDAADGVPRYLCAVETAWHGPESATDWSRLPSFPVFWAAVVEQTLSYSAVRGRGARLFAARVGEPFVARDSQHRWSREVLKAFSDAHEQQGTIHSVRRLGSAYAVTAWNCTMISPKGWPPMLVSLLDREVTRTAAPAIPPPSLEWGEGPESGESARRPGASLAALFLGPALLAFFAAWFFDPTGTSP